MIEDPEHAKEREASIRPRVSRWAVVRFVGGAVVSLGVVGAVIASLLALFHPETPLPREWNPTVPFAAYDPVTPLTQWKLRRTIADPATCRAVLDDVAQVTVMAPLNASEECHVRNRVSISSVGEAQFETVETSCATALRLALWEYHGLQPAAQDIFGTQVSSIRQVGSYNCRPIRTAQGATNR